MSVKQKAYIYGAGEYAISEFYRIANSYNILGFVVSKLDGQPSKVMNVPVLSIDEFNDSDALFIICSSYFNDIEKTLLEKGFHNFYTVEQLINKNIVTGERMFKESHLINISNENIRRVIALTDLNKRGVVKNVVVSLTSFSARFPNLDLVIKSIKQQTLQPEKIILWVSHADYEKLPLKVSVLQDEQFEVHQCDDLKSYKKLIPALEKFPGKTIVTADDDLYYWPNWLNNLVEVHKLNPAAIVAHRVHRINPGKISTYLDWEHASISPSSQNMSPLNFPVGVAGVLYPPGCFYSDVFNRDLFMQLCPTGDDIWFYWMFRLNGRSAIGTGVKDCLISIDNYMSPSLCEKNLFQGENDKQIENMMNKYGFIGG